MATRHDIEQGWQRLREALGPELAAHLPFVREYLGDVQFIRLAAEFSGGEVIVACGIEHAAMLINLPRRRQSRREQRLFKAIRAARATVNR